VTTLLVSTSKELNVSIPAVDLETQVDAAGGRLRAEIEDASAGLVTVAADGSWVSFAVPVGTEASWGAAGDCQPRWGAKLGTSETTGGLNALVFEESTDPGVSPVNESDVIAGGLNINVNTEATPDTSDSFAVGHLAFVYDPDGSFPTLSGDEESRAVTGDWVVQVRDSGGAFGGDIDGDEAADPLFALNGTSVGVDLWGLAVVRTEETPLMVNSRSVVALANP
jgi:hypothetical protein